ncbi:DNA polymerase III subunit chi [Algirhabdus cladophorae]|uniref:DNA polymerase III subunit chi n=1 Tax=Algirhabdus cladophorae TaxID=3377108 RepID=UPI003B848773
MGAVYFYHLTRNPIEVTLPMLLGKARQAGWRVMVKGSNPVALEQIDAKLWLADKDGFLPHGLSGGAHDAEQPILLGCEDTRANEPACVMAIHGADISAQTVADMERCCVLFDGNDGDALNRARSQWKTLTDAGVAAQYWSEESGRWEKKAEKNG